YTPKENKKKGPQSGCLFEGGKRERRKGPEPGFPDPSALGGSTRFESDNIEILPAGINKGRPCCDEDGAALAIERWPN
ncbi:MAG: hypothetical protein LBQ88_00600, partial [Treponema sp.]|nr:hypothetical protein [Treponema sp.]